MGSAEWVGVRRTMINKHKNFRAIDVVEERLSAVAILRLLIEEPRLVVEHQGVALGMSNRPKYLALSLV